MVAGEITTKGLRQYPGYRPKDHHRDRLHPGEVRLRRRDLRDHGVGPLAVPRYLHGRGHRRRRRPGPHVRLCLRRDARAHADDHHAGTQAHPQADRSAEERRSCRTCGRTGSPRSRSSTGTANPTRSIPWLSRASTAPMSTRSRSAQDIIEKVIKPVLPKELARR